MTERTLYFIRHGQTEWNRIKRMQGQWNSDLDDHGRGQADANGRLLSGFGLDALYCSPLDRTRQTAGFITRHVPLPVTYDDRLMEWDSGDWSGHMYADLPDRWPAEWAAWKADPFHARAPGGENYPDMFDRAQPFLAELLETGHRRIGIISHGMIGKVMIAGLASYDAAATLAIHQRNDVVFRVQMVGDTVTGLHHFAAGNGPFEGLHLTETTPGPA
ncbi:MAG: histidine phosphatase family protein [Pseudomonadota bacterium]